MKISNEQVEHYVYEFEYVLKNKYTHAHNRIILECPNGHQESYLFREFKRGKRCTSCRKEFEQQKRMTKFKYLVESQSSYQLLTLLDNRTLEIRCDEGHVYQVVWDSFKKGHRCPKCAKCAKYTYGEIKECIENENYRLVEENYKNANSHMNLVCPNGHDYKTTFNSFRLGNRCQKCYLESNIGENSSNWKGGITPLQQYMRGKIAKWKLDSLKKYNFECFVTRQKSADLVVHHLISFSDILLETLDDLSLGRKHSISLYSEAELTQIESALIEKHYKYGLGVPLLPSVHRSFHDIYGWGSNTKEQFEEFLTKLNM